ncbi:SusD family protein [bacterium A37T11]|nr:SusD family protein [bacterium A37T11]
MKKLFIIICPLLIISLQSCKKYLDVKSNESYALPGNLTDLQSILDNQSLPYYGVGSTDDACDDYYLTNTSFNALYGEASKNFYTWKNSNIFELATPNSGDGTNDWSLAYAYIYYANTVLGYMDKFNISPDEQMRANDIKGQALFHRARMFLELIFAFAKGYDASSAATDLGLPLRLTTDFNQKTSRSSVEETYQLIIKDLKTATTLLPDQSIHVLRPTKAAAYGMLARTYLSMRDYENSGLYADSCLYVNSTLLDYNSITDFASPFPQFLVPELKFYSMHGFNVSAYYFGALMDTVFIRLYDTNDLRKSLFYIHNLDDTYSYNASYAGFPGTGFDGIATDEMYLIRAEAFARKGNLVSAMKDLDALLKNRYSNSVPYASHLVTDQQQAINLILQERRKELVFRGLRWMDVKRLNLEGANITLKRIVNGTTYTLPPNSPRYAIPIPDDIIQLSGIEQNPY